MAFIKQHISVPVFPFVLSISLISLLFLFLFRSPLSFPSVLWSGVTTNLSFLILAIV